MTEIRLIAPETVTVEPVVATLVEELPVSDEEEFEPTITELGEASSIELQRIAEDEAEEEIRGRFPRPNPDAESAAFLQIANVFGPTPYRSAEEDVQVAYELARRSCPPEDGPVEERRDRRRRRGRGKGKRARQREEASTLARDHCLQVFRRPQRIRKAMDRVVGLVWLNQGQRYRPLGSTSLLVQYSVDGRPFQVCVVPKRQPDIAGPRPVVEYDVIRMVHHWGESPVPGERGVVLDPRFPNDPSLKEGEQAHGMWVLAGLRVDAARERMIDEVGALPPAPTMPIFMVGYKDKPLYTGLTPFLRGDAEAAKLDPDSHQFFAHAQGRFEQEIVMPAQSGLNIFLVPMDCVAAMTGYEAIYEDFGELLGATVPNPMLNASAIRARNPAFDAARARRIHLRDFLSELEGHSRSFTDETLQEQHLDSVGDRLISGMREKLGTLADAFLEDDLFNGIRKPESDLISTKVLGGMTAEQRQEKFRELADPDVREAITAEELATAAAADPYVPIKLSHMVRIQTIHRQVDMGLMQSLEFPAAALNRDDVVAAFCPPADWAPRKRRPGSK